jgi:putative aldouronate transport system permease protein
VPNNKNERLYQFVSQCILIVLSLMAIIPFVIMISTSFSENSKIIQTGYSLLPRGFSLDAYDYIFTNIEVVGRAYLVTIFVTATGVLAGLILTSMTAYVVSRDDLPGRGILMFLVVFTMLFNGGLVPTYYVYTKLIHIKDTPFGLIVPNLLMNAFNIILVQNYYRFNIPKSIEEAARIEGAGDMTIFLKMMFPLALPISATISLMTGIFYWNDWQNALYYLTDPTWNTIQQVLRLMNSNLSYLMNVGGMQGVDRILPTATIRMAIALMVALPIIIAYPFFQKYFKKGITFGALKG